MSKPVAEATTQQGKGVESGARGRRVGMKKVLLVLTVAILVTTVASGVALAATIMGTRGHDSLSGTAASDDMYGLGGGDSLAGRGGHDYIEGGAADDVLSGGPGIDLISGGFGNDAIYSDNGGGELYGGPGADLIFGSAGLADEVYGNSGDDRIVAQDGAFDYVDCGLYQSATSTAPDFDTANVDVGLDATFDCERVY